MKELIMNSEIMKIGRWTGSGTSPEPGTGALKRAISRVSLPIHIVSADNQLAVSQTGTSYLGESPEGDPLDNTSYPLLAYVPPLPPENLGDTLFKKAYKIRYPYIAGAMANGITSAEMVEEAGRSGMLGFFGSAGLSLNEIDTAIGRLRQNLSDIPFGFNLINSPNDPELENAVVQLYLDRGIKLVSASAYLDLTPPLVYYRVKGIRRDGNGEVVCPNRIIAKVSRVEVAKKFFSPPPDKFLSHLIERGMITREEAALADSIPMADDLTAEADSGGHTDNRPALSLLPTITALRNEMARKYNFSRTISIGLGGGIATPDSAAAAFTLGAAYIVTGSINQACVEAGISDNVREMLSQARQADITMAPAADMFEMGVKVQVLKRGTMFPLRAGKLYSLYSSYDSYDQIPDKQKEILERDFFRNSFEKEWENTIEYFSRTDPVQLQRAEKQPKHKMALVFRSYLGKSSMWAKTGDPSRKIDYQIWCGPAMGAFNEWARGSFLEDMNNRKFTTVAMNILYGASIATRANWLRNQKIVIPGDADRYRPENLEKIIEMIAV